MSTTLLAAMQELSRQLGDYWSSTTDGAGTAPTLVDSALMAKANDWITDNSWAFLIEEPASAAAIYDERKVSSLDNTTGTLTALTFAAAPGTGIDYEVHRLFSPSEKRTALVAAARRVHPILFQEVVDESLVSGNWLRDGSFERWSSSSALTDWTTTTSTIAQTSTAYLFKHGSYSCKLSTAAGNIKQSVTNHDDLKRLAGKSVTFSAQGHCDTASCLRIAIYDGTTYTYSNYHTGNSAWTTDADPLEVTATIRDNPTAIQFIVYHDVAAGVSYVDDARVISGYCEKLYIGGLQLVKNTPHQVFMSTQYYPTSYTSWQLIRDIEYDTTTGFMYLPPSVPPNRQLRVLGIGALNFVLSGAVSTAWTATISINQPQLEILIAEAVLGLYTQLSLPNFETGTRKQFQEAMGYWVQEIASRKNKFGMTAPPATVNWGNG